jgi:hypothetical protein
MAKLQIFFVVLPLYRHAATIVDRSFKQEAGTEVQLGGDAANISLNKSQATKLVNAEDTRLTIQGQASSSRYSMEVANAFCCRLSFQPGGQSKPWHVSPPLQDFRHCAHGYSLTSIRSAYGRLSGDGRSTLLLLNLRRRSSMRRTVGILDLIHSIHLFREWPSR